MIINWSKTKYMIQTNKKIEYPKLITIVNNKVVDDLKLLGIHLDRKLTFEKYVDN